MGQELEQADRLAWFTANVLPHEPALRRYLVGRLANRSELDDIVSETLIRAYTIDRFERFDRGKALLFTIARNFIYDEMRRQRVISFEALANLRGDPADEAPLPDRIVSGQEEVKRLLALVEMLPNQCRQVFILRRVHDFSPREIAERMSLSVSTVEKHLTRALVLLTRMLAENEISGPINMAEVEWRETGLI